MSLIAIEARALSGPFVGTVRYIRGLIPALQRAAPEHTFTLLSDHARGLAAFPGLEGEVVSPSHPLLRLYWDFLALPAAVRRRRPALLHLTKPAGTPFRRGLPPIVTTIYDVIPLDFPGTQTLVQRTYWRVQLPMAARTASHILTISDVSRRAICERLGVRPENVTVTSPGIDAAFTPQSADAIASVRSRQKISGRYILTVGTIEPRKNVDRLLRAFTGVVGAIPHTLVIAGRWGWKTETVREAARDPRLHGRVRFLGIVADDDLPALYSGADAAISLSRAEGFGFPILESMACGTPVIVSNCGSLSEIAGAAAILVDPDDLDAVADALVRAVSDTALRARLVHAGTQRAAAFTWDRTATQTLAVYEKILRRT